MKKKDFFVPKGKKEYKKYLSSSSWRKLRNTVLFVFGYQCVFCGDKKYLNVLHLRYYKKMYNPDSSLYKKIRWLTVVCKYCHANIHEISKKENLEEYKATKRYSSLMKYPRFRMPVRKLKKKLREYKEQGGDRAAGNEPQPVA